MAFVNTRRAASEPCGEDLAQLLSNLGQGKRADTRSRLANQPETWMYLEAGRTLLQDDLLSHTGPDLDAGLHSRLFESLSHARLQQRAAESDPDHAKLLTVNMYRSRWPRKDYYTEDLIAYIFRPGPMQARLDELSASITKPLMKLDLSELVRHIAMAVIQGMAADRLSSLQPIIETALPSHPTVRRNVRELSATTLPRWAGLYQRIGNAQGYALRPGYTWMDMALLFSLVTLGVLARTRLYGSEPRLSTGEGVLDAAILAMLPSMVERQPGPRERPDAAMPLPQAAHESERPRRAAGRDDDLSGVLRHIGYGKLATTKRRLANDKYTREFLELGLGLLQEDWLEYVGPDFDRGLRSRLFASLSRERIIQRAVDLFPGHAKSLTVNSYRYRWQRKDHYTEDLISFLFRPAPFIAQFDRIAAAATVLVSADGAALADVVRRLAGAVSDVWLTDPTIGLQAIIQAALPSHRRVREMRAQVDAMLPRWAGLYERIAACYDIELRPGIAWLDVAMLFSLVSSVLPRTRAHGAAPRLSSGEDAFAGAIIAMLPALVRQRTAA